MKLNRQHIFHTPRVKQQILRIFFLAAILPILILGIFSVVQVRRQMSEHYASQVKADGLRVNSILFDVTTSLFTSSESITSNKKCLRLFGSDYTTDSMHQAYSDMDTALRTLYDTTAAISSVCIYTDNPNIPDSDYITYTGDYEASDWYGALGENGWNTWTCLCSTDQFGNESYEPALVRRIGVTSSAYRACLVIRLDHNYLKNRFEQSSYRITVALDELPVFYASDSSLLRQPLTVPADFDGQFYRYTGALTVNGTQTLSNIVTLRPYKTDNLFFICVSDPSAYDSMDHMTLLYVCIILLATIVPALVIFFFSSYFSDRVTTLKQAMHQARLGDYNIIDSFSGDDELQETFEDLKATVQMIHEKEARYYEAQLNEQQLINHQQEMEFKMLASQINPHFLYNTLETIRMQALSNGNRDVATSIKLLGKTMHYVLENTGTSFTTLTKELDYVDAYLSIQRLRFGDRVNVSLQIGEGLDTDSYRILPLLLQPIVENAVIHGLEGVEENGHIQISVTADEPNLVITIADNGTGMDAETLAALQQNVTEHDPNDTRSIGLYNINQRIRLLYGDAYGLSITSDTNGTTVTLTLPLTEANL